MISVFFFPSNALILKKVYNDNVKTAIIKWTIKFSCIYNQNPIKKKSASNFFLD